MRALPARAFLLPLAVVLLGGAVIPATNFAFSGRVYYSDETHMYLMARLTHDGLAQRELREHCATAQYLLCPYQASLAHVQGDDYLFAPDSPVRKIGGWDASRNDSWRLILNSVRDYPLEHFEAAVHDVAVTAIAVRTGYGLDVYSTYYAVNNAIHGFYPSEYSSFLASRQQNGRLALETVNAVDVPAAIAAAVVLVAFLLAGLSRRAVSPRLLLLDVGVISAFVANALVTGLTSVPGADRYQSRVACLLVLAAIINVGALLEVSRSRASATRQPAASAVPSEPRRA